MKCPRIFTFKCTLGNYLPADRDLFPSQTLKILGLERNLKSSKTHSKRWGLIPMKTNKGVNFSL